MTAPVKFIIAVIILLVVTVSALAVLVRTQLTPERIRTTLLPLAEERLQGQVDFAAVEISFFSGISVSELKIQQSDSEEALLAVNSLQLHYQLFPLLWGKVVIDKVFLDQPLIRAVRRSDNSFNFSDLLPPRQPDVQQQKRPADKSSAHSSLSFPLRLLIKEVAVRDGTIDFIDRFKNPATPYRFQLRQLNFEARQITLEERFPIVLSAVLNDAKIDIQGHYDIASTRSELVIQTAALDLIRLSPYFREQLPATLGSGLLSTNLEIDIQPAQMDVKGQIKLDRLDLTWHHFPESPLEGASLGADFALSYLFNERLLDFSTLLVRLNELGLGAEGRLDLGDTGAPLFDGVIKLDQLDLRLLMQALPVELIRDYQGYSPAGMINGSFKIAGAFAAGGLLVQSGRIHLDDVQLSIRNIRAGLSGEMTYADQTLAADALVLTYGELKSALNLRIKNPFSSQIQGSFVLSAEELDLNPLLEASDGLSASKIETEQGTAASPAEERQPAILDCSRISFPGQITGQLNIDRLWYRRLALEALTADVNWNRRHLSLDHLQSRLARSGSLSAVAGIDFLPSGLVYQGHFSLDLPDLSNVVSSLWPESGLDVLGRMQWQGTLSGQLKEMEQPFAGLRTQGRIQIEQGQLKGLDFTHGLAAFTGISELKLLSFSTLDGHYQAAQELVQLQAELESSWMHLQSQGTVDFAGALDLDLEVKTAPDLGRQLTGEGQQRLLDQKGWDRLPLKISGTLKKPEFSVDAKKLGQQVAEQVQDKVRQKLEPKVDAGKEPLQKLLDSTLNRLFGK